jgi:NADH:ubiquinone oxidoreductase subunit E
MEQTDRVDVVRRDDNQHGRIIAALEAVQAQYGYLPEDALREVADRLGRSLVDIYGVATFYRAFSLKPRGRHLVSACLGTACHVRGGPAVARELQNQLGVRPGDTTADNEFTLETVNCLGACALGPVVVIDGHYFSKVRPSMISGIISRARAGLDVIQIDTDPRIFPLDVNCARCNHTLMDPGHPLDGRPSIRVTVSYGQRHSWMALSSQYGSYHIETEYDVPNDTLVQFSCPHCHADLIGGAICGDCGAPMVPMLVKGGGVVQFCSRRGCRGHILDLNGTTLG